MECPKPLDENLKYVQKAISDQALFDLLKKKTEDLFLFCVKATEDQAWFKNHEPFISLALNFFTQEAYEGKITEPNLKKISDFLRKHWPSLSPFIQENILITFKSGDKSFNGLILASSSPYLNTLLLKECRDKKQNILPLKEITETEFVPIANFLTMGYSFEVLTMGVDGLMYLLKLATQLKIEEFCKLCERMLVKYFALENVFSYLLQGKNEHRLSFQLNCAQFINAQNLKFKIYPYSDEFLAFEFLEFNESSLSYLSLFSTKITHLICRGILSEQVELREVLKKIPHLIALDVSESLSTKFLEAPLSKNLTEIDISETPSLSRVSLIQLKDLCPNLKKIALGYNSQLHYLEWGELAKFTHLIALNLGGCVQIDDNELSVILKGAPYLTDLSLNDCRKIGEKGFLEIGKFLFRLNFLNLSKSRLSDTALVDIAHQCQELSELNISFCDQLTEKGILALIKIAPQMRDLHLTEGALSSPNIERWQQLNPYLKIHKS